MTQIDIPADVLASWQAAANDLGEHGHALRLELADFSRDPTRHMLQRCAKAARMAEHHLTGNAALLANTIATQLEDAAR